MPDPSPKQLTIVFPIGGKGERMGAIDVPSKALVKLPEANRTLLEWSAAVWSGQFDSLVLLVPPEYDQIQQGLSQLSSLPPEDKIRAARLLARSLSQVWPDQGPGLRH